MKPSNKTYNDFTQTETVICYQNTWDENGEVTEVPVKIVKNKPTHYWRLYLRDFITSLAKLNMGITDVLCVILENTSTYDNICYLTQKKLAKATGLSEKTVGRHIQALIDAGFIAKVENGKYFVNPKILLFSFKTDESHKKMLMSHFAETTMPQTEAKHTGQVKAKSVKKNAESRRNNKNKGENDNVC